MCEQYNRSGYEIRLELINLSKEILVDKFHIEREPLYNQYLQQISNNTEVKDIDLEKLPKYPTSKEILELATELYQFVLKQH